MADPYPTWTKKGTWEITVNFPGANYTVPLTVTYWTGMNSDFSDIRFSDSADTIIPYYIVSKTDGVEASILIKTTAQSSGTLHYGNETATSESSEEAVYLECDNFSGENGAAPNTEKWTPIDRLSTSGADADANIQLDGNGNLVLGYGSTSTGFAGIISSKTFQAGLEIIVCEKTSDIYYLDTSLGNAAEWQSTDGGNLSNLYHVGLGGGYAWKVQDASIQGSFIRMDVDTPLTELSNAFPAPFPLIDTYYIHRYIWTGSVLKHQTDSGTIGTSSVDTTYQNESLNLLIANGWFTGLHVGTRTIDYIKIKKYITTDPTFTITEASSEPTYYYPILEFNEENEMQQITGTTKSHPVQIRSLTTGDIVTEITDTPVFTVKRYTSAGIVKTTPTLTITGYDNDTMEFDVQIPDTLATTPGEGIIVNVSCNTADGQGTFYVNVVSDPSAFATSTALSTIDNVVDGIKTVTDTLTTDYFETRVATALEGYNTSTLTAQQVWEYVTRTLTSAGAGGATAQEVWEYATRTLTSGGTATSGGSESIITGYTHVASARTIDTGDTSLTVEQIKYILNLTTGSEIYNSAVPRKRRMSLTAPDNEGIDISVGTGEDAGVITYIEDSGMTNDDKLLIIVRPAHTTI